MIDLYVYLILALLVVPPWAAVKHLAHLNRKARR